MVTASTMVSAPCIITGNICLMAKYSLLSRLPTVVKKLCNNCGQLQAFSKFSKTNKFLSTYERSVHDEMHVNSNSYDQ